jgi:hypothetical protein
VQITPLLHLTCYSLVTPGNDKKGARHDLAAEGARQDNIVWGVALEPCPIDDLPEAMLQA